MARSRLRSVRLDIIRTLLRNEARASSNVPRICLGSVVMRSPHQSTEATGYVFLRLALARVRKNPGGLIHFDEAAEIKEGGAIGAAASLLHVVSDDDDRV